jgi:Na+/H+-dicarboxylate symporter
MPALLDCAKKRMGLPSSTSGVIIPFFVTTFRVNYSISTTFSLLFLAHTFQVSLEFQTVVVFLLLQFLISFGSPGIPSGGHYLNISFYLAAGLPIEGVLLMKAVDHIPDIFKTALNVTEVMTVTSVTSKWGKKKRLIN